MNTDHTTPELFAALAAAQAEIVNASKNSTNPHFRSTYADLGEVLNTIRPPFAKHGLCLIQSPSFSGETVEVTTTIAHSAGGWIASTLSCIPAKSDAQGIGSVITYLRRYSAAGMAGIAQEDDDGQSAAHSTPPAPAPIVRKAPAQRPAPATPPVDPRRKGWIDDLKSAYHAARVPDGNAAGEMLRKAGLLGADERVPDMTDDGLEAAWKVRFEIFPPPAE